MWLRNKKTGGLFNTDDIKGNYIKKLNDISKREYENKIDKTEYDEEIRKATEDYKREKAINEQRQNDLYQSKVFGTDVTKLDKQMKDLFGEDFKYAEDISPMSEYSDTTGTGLSDKQHTALTNMSLSKMQSMAREYGVETKGLTKKQLMAKLITIFNK